MNKLTYLMLVALLCLSPIDAKSSNTSTASTNSDIQRVRIDFVTPLGYTRHLLLAFTSNNVATDGVDYGYDASNIENLPDDLNWRIDDGNYIIQGVGAFDTSKSYPLGMFLTNSGEIQIALNQLENFEVPIDVYVFDAEDESFTPIHAINFTASFESGDYLNRFFITFTNNLGLIDFENSAYGALSVNESLQNEPSITYLSKDKQIHIEAFDGGFVESVTLYNIQGQLIKTITFNNPSKTRRIRIGNYLGNLVVSLTTTQSKIVNKHILTF